MTDEAQEVNTQEVPQEADKPTPAPNSDGVPEWARDPKAAYAEIQKLRAEQKENRLALEEADRKKRDDEQADLEKKAEWEKLAQSRADELDNLKAEAEQMKAARRDDAVKMAIANEAAKAGFADPNDAYNLADLSVVEVNDGNDVSGADQAIKALIAAKPYLVGKRAPAPATDGGTGNPLESTPTVELNDAQRQGVERAKRLGYKVDIDAVRKRAAAQKLRPQVGVDKDK
jgi:hypothetical protein